MSGPLLVVAAEVGRAVGKVTAELGAVAFSRPSVPLCRNEDPEGGLPGLLDLRAVTRGCRLPWLGT